MHALDALLERRSIRSFKTESVSKEVITGILETVRWVPSSRNTQPCELTVVGGPAMDELKAQLTAKVEADAEARPDIPAAELSEPFISRALAQRDAIDSYQFPPGTEDLAGKRADYWIRGGRFFDAPNAIIISMEKALYPSALIDVGLMIHAICISAYAHGVDTCPTRRPVYWPELLRQLFNIPESKMIVFSIALGYREPQARVNNFSRFREPLDSWVTWQGL